MGGRGAKANIQEKSPIVDKGFDVTKQKPTKAAFPENMNEAQLLKEIARMERRTASATREQENAYNSASLRRMEETFRAFPGGVGGSAVNDSYRKMVDRGTAQMRKGIEAGERATEYSRQLESYKKALQTVKGSGLLVHEAETARRAVGGTLDGKWTKSTVNDPTFGNIPAQKNGEFKVANNWGKYRIFRNDKEIGFANKAAEAKALIEKYAKRKKK